MVKKHFFRFFRKYRQFLFILFLGMVTFLIFVPIFTYMYFARDLTTKDGIMNRNDTGLLLTDRNGKPFFSFYQAKQRSFVSLSQIPKHLQEGLISTEDEEFYTHPGFSIKGIVRSIILDIQARKGAYGGSTITQQLVKNVLLSSKKSYLRKYQEIVLASEIERRYSKTEILEMYLNSVYFGEGAFGVENAALDYFGKHAKDLNLAESSMLVGILPAPSSFSPISGNKNSALIRQKLVLKNMLEQKYITKQQYETALKTSLNYASVREDINLRAPHFALMVKEALVRKFGEEMISRSGFRVRTSLNLEWQEYAEQVVEDQVENLKNNNVSNGAAVVINPKTGEVNALVGSVDWYDTEFGKVNITTSTRQPGSSFKPIIYAAGLEEGLITPATVLKDEPTTFEGNYKPLDYDKKFRGKVLTRRALANSLNIPSVDVMSRVGVPKGLEMASRLGISTLKDPSHYGLSLVLGTGEVKLLELTNAYATFANKGVYHDVTTILEIDDKRGQKIYSFTPEPKQALESSVAFLISSILSDNRARAEVFGSALTISRPAAVKTGTTENYHDALTIGYTPSLAVGVWVGNNDGRLMDQVAGSLGAAPIWKSLMERFLQGTSIEKFAPPAGVVQLSVCSFNGLISREATTSAVQEYFVNGTEPTRYCNGSGGIQLRRESPMPSGEVTIIPPVTDQPTGEAPKPTEEAKPAENNSNKDEKKVEKLRAKLLH